MRNPQLKMNKISCMLLLTFLALLCANFIKPTSAIVPVIQNVVVWGSGSDTILNVTVLHTPVIPTHRVDRIEVNVSGTIHVFNLIQNTTTFTYPCNLGPIEGTPSATVRARCTVDGYSPWTEPIQIPEFSSHVMLLISILVTSLALLAFRKIKK